ncbi:hypothetical protein BHM03_00045431 [Ensete ventricosum]|nr:hypothetical protein BHM03_00045431 [Ensete ventricosum]
MAWPPARGRLVATKVPCKGAVDCDLSSLEERPATVSPQSGRGLPAIEATRKGQSPAASLRQGLPKAGSSPWPGYRGNHL